MQFLNKKHLSYLKGIIAEYYVMFFLMLKGYRLVKRRYRNFAGEIDLVMHHKKTLVAIEVKYRKTIDDGLFSIQNKQKNRIMNALQIISGYYPNYGVRCDVCIVNYKGYIRHISNGITY